LKALQDNILALKQFVLHCCRCCAVAPVCCAGASVKVLALDAAQPFDFEHRMQNKISKDKQLKIGIVGFGTFGQFLARRMVEAGHRWVGPQACHRPVHELSP
jgi:hypothetical protein